MPLYAYSTWTPEFLRSIGGDCALAVVSVVAAMLIAAVPIRKMVRHHRGEGQSGLIVIHFVLVLPILLCLLLVIFQITLIVHAKLVVNYAAFAATRSAIVVIPSAVFSRSSKKIERENEIDGKDPDGPKMKMIRWSAAVACTGISPPLDKVLARIGTIDIPSNEERMIALAALHPRTGEVLSRAGYSLSKSNTKVEVRVEKKGNGKAGAWSLVTARVTHRYYLTVPFANRVLGKPFTFAGLLSLGAYYAEISEEYTLPASADRIRPSGQPIDTVI